MTYFNPSFLKFFKELSKNNSTAWFNENRKTYEKEVKKHFSDFVQEMIAHPKAGVGSADKTIGSHYADQQGHSIFQGQNTLQYPCCCQHLKYGKKERLGKTNSF